MILIVISITRTKSFFHPSVKPTEPVLSKALEESVTTHEAQSLKLTAKVTPESDLTISWMKDGEPLKSDAHYKITANKDGTQTLNIRSVKLEDSAEYSIKFTNAVGDTITTSKVSYNTFLWSLSLSIGNYFKALSVI